MCVHHYVFTVFTCKLVLALTLKCEPAAVRHWWMLWAWLTFTVSFWRGHQHFAVIELFESNLEVRSDWKSVKVCLPEVKHLQSWWKQNRRQDASETVPHEFIYLFFYTFCEFYIQYLIFFVATWSYCCCFVVSILSHSNLHLSLLQATMSVSGQPRKMPPGHGVV